MVADGGKEIVLTGVNMGDFGQSTGETFADLVRALDEVEGIERYRISSLEPDLLHDETIDFVSHSRRFMPHFHIPLQSGSIPKPVSFILSAKTILYFTVLYSLQC